MDKKASKESKEIVVRKRQLFPHHKMCEIQRFVGHDKFRRYLFLALKVKAIKASLLAGTVPNESEVLAFLSKRSGEDALNYLLLKIQSKIIPAIDNRAFVYNIHYVPNGAFVATDSLILESIYLLEKEFMRCMEWYTSSASSQPLTNSNARASRIKTPRIEGPPAADLPKPPPSPKKIKPKSHFLTQHSSEPPFPHL
mmetsp:Transcript_15649/g.22922  ORF Transcript_15649/g.22922 Transcript_15649/m.22922 type:complete len:197 (-) Transcript_15649:38-628(-)